MITDWQRFLLISLIPAVLGVVGIGLWVSAEIERDVLHQAGTFTSLSVSSLIEPLTVDLMTGNADSGRAALDQRLRARPMSGHLARVVVWGPDGRRYYETGQQPQKATNPVPSVEKSLRGWVVAELASSDAGQPLLHVFGPVRQPGSDAVAAVVECFQTLDQFEARLAGARQRSWLVVGFAMSLVYVVLAFLVRPSFATVRIQQSRMADQLAEMGRLLAWNENLGKRVREASEKTATMHEQVLRRVGAELHDGPAQDISLALLRLESLDRVSMGGDQQLIETALQNALKEIRSLAAGLSLPELGGLTLPEAVKKAVQAHERRSGSQVTFLDHSDNAEASDATKIAAYRVIQESLANAFRHAGGKDQVVALDHTARGWELMVSDGGSPEHGKHPQSDGNERLGVTGMRERVESLGGSFSLEQSLPSGTVVRVFLPQEPTSGAP